MSMNRGEQFGMGIDPGLHYTGIAIVRIEYYIQREIMKPISITTFTTETINQKDPKDIGHALSYIERYPPIKVYCEESDGKLKREVERHLNRVSGGYQLNSKLRGDEFEYIKRSEIAYRLILNPYYQKQHLRAKIIRNEVATEEQLRETSNHEIDAVGIATAGALKDMNCKLDFNRIIPSESAVYYQP